MCRSRAGNKKFKIIKIILGIEEIKLVRYRVNKKLKKRVYITGQCRLVVCQCQYDGMLACR